ncbi:MAG: hypothetical protein P1V97_12785 [Planctomycetota bacterium]|nr:hypothetical protein [Planctomycetota bacterium]
MNDNQRDELLFNLLQSESKLSSPQQEILAKELDDNSQLKEQCHNDLHIHDMLTGHFQEHSSAESFVQGVMDRLEREASPAPARIPVWGIWAFGFAAVAAACLLLFQNSSSITPVDAPESSEPVKRLQGFARLTPTSLCVWDQEPPLERLGHGILKLKQGTAQISFDDGPAMEISGPARFEMVSPGRAILHQGRLSAKLPASNVSFELGTPLSTLRDQSGAFNMTVADDGTTDLAVTEGEIFLTSLREKARVWKLGRQFQSVTVYAGPDRKMDSEAVVLRNNKGPFQGIISLNGEQFTFDNFEDFDKAKARFLGRFQNFSKRFRDFRETLDQKRRKLRKEANLEGDPPDLEDLAKFRKAFLGRLRKNLKNHVEQRKKNAQSNSSSQSNQSGSKSFHGVIEIDGKKRVFDNEKDYREAQQRLKNKRPH